MTRITPDRDAQDLAAANRRSVHNSEEPPVLVMVDVVRRNGVILGAAVVLGLVAGVAWTLATPRLYTAQAILRAPTPLLDAGANAPSTTAEFRPILLNRQNVAASLQKHHLTSKWSTDRFIEAACGLDVMKGTSVAMLSVTLPDPVVAATITNELVEQGVQLSRKLNVEEITTARSQFADVVKTLGVEEANARQQYLEYRKSAQVEALRSDVNKLLDERISLVDITTDIAQKRAALERATLERNARPELISAERAVEGSSLQEPVREATGRSTAGVKMSEQSVNAVRQELDYQVGTLNTEIAGLEKRRTELIEKYGVNGATLAKLDQLYIREVELARLQADHEISKRVYETALTHYRSLTSEVMQRKADLLVEDPAIPPTEPNSRKGLTKLVISLAAALAAAAVMVAWREAGRYER